MHIFGGLYMKRLLSVALAFLLMLGLASPALAAKAKAVTMRVELVEGSVTIRDAGGVALDYFEGIQLYSGYSVETGDDSCAYISLDEEKAIKLAMNTAVSIKKSGRKLQVKLKAGEIVFNVTTPLAGNETLEIRTSTMITGVRGSSGGVNAETGEIFYGTGHGIVWFRETDQTSSLYGLSQRTELWGGRIVSVNWPVKDMELSDFSALFLGEVAENPDLQNSLKMEGRFDPQDMINLLPLILEAEIAAREEAKSSAVPLPESATDSPVNGDNVNPAFNNNWDLPTIVTPPPIIDLDDFIIPDDPMNPDEPETTAYTVTWQDEDGTILEKDENVPVGTVPEFNGSDPIKAADAQYTYTFAGWDSIPAAVTGDAIYTATYKETPKTYTVTWKVDDETTTVKYDYGSVIVPPADPTKTGYTFTGWGGNVPETMPAENLSFTAQWDVNTYTVTWKQNDGTLINTTTVAYGEVPTHAAPTKEADAQYTYTFAGWNTTPVAVTGNATYTATYSTTTNTYTITWKQDDGTVINTTTVAYGDVPTHTDPTKAADAQFTYTFAGWTPAVADVTADATYTATYSSTVNKYTITWKNANGEVLKTDENVEYGTLPSYNGTIPTKTDDDTYTYVFSNWSPEISDVTGDVTYTPQFTQYRIIDQAFFNDEFPIINEPSAIIIDDVIAESPVTQNADLYIKAGSSLALYSNMTVSEGATLIIDGTLTIETGFKLTNNGTITNNGSIENRGTVINNGTMNNYSPDTISNYGYFHNLGTLNNGADADTRGSFINDDGGFLVNAGTFLTSAGSSFTNYAILIKTIPNNDSSVFQCVGSYDNIGVEAYDGGFCGASTYDVVWYMLPEGEGYTLDLYGDGDIADYDSSTDINPPWYSYRNSITALAIGSGVTKIGNYAFADISVASVEIPDTVASIGNYAFEYNDAITSLHLPYSVTSVGRSAFMSCASLTTVTIDDGLKIIGESAFSGCGSLTTVALPTTLTTIDGYAFMSTGLTVIAIPENVSSIGESAFNHCNALTEIHFWGNPPNILGDSALGSTEGKTIWYPDIYSEGWETAMEGGEYYGYDLREERFTD